MPTPRDLEVPKSRGATFGIILFVVLFVVALVFAWNYTISSRQPEPMAIKVAASIQNTPERWSRDIGSLAYELPVETDCLCYNTLNVSFDETLYGRPKILSVYVTYSADQVVNLHGIQGYVNEQAISFAIQKWLNLEEKTKKHANQKLVNKTIKQIQ